MELLSINYFHKKIHEKCCEAYKYDILRSSQSEAWNFIKKRLQHSCFPVDIAKFLNTPILKNFRERLLLHIFRFSRDTGKWGTSKLSVRTALHYKDFSLRRKNYNCHFSRNIRILPRNILKKFLGLCDNFRIAILPENLGNLLLLILIFPQLTVMRTIKKPCKNTVKKNRPNMR